MRHASVIGTGVAFPPSRSQQDLWEGFYRDHCGHSKWARRVFLGAGCETRHVAVDPLVEDISSWSTGARMGRYVAEAMPIGQRATEAALRAAGVIAADIGMFAVVSCTGYATPGLDILLADSVGMSVGTQRLLVGHMGCYAALPGLGAVSDYVAARGRPAVLLCVEVSSLHVQPPTSDLQQILAHALFSDGAAALVVVPPGTAAAQPGWEVIDLAARTAVDSADQMRWDITDLGFRMGLSRQVPDVLARHVAPMVGGLLAANHVDPSDVEQWAVHPGGPRILDVVADRLGLDEVALGPSRRVLAAHGNCSSATVMVVLDELARGPALRPGSFTVALAFGPGLTLYAALLRPRPVS